MSRPRLAIEWIVLASVAALMFRTFCGQWQVVASGSMAETLRGPHFQITCVDCSYSFSCDSALPPSEHAECPNCGYPLNELGEPFSGDRLAVNRSAFFWRPPKRWEVIVFGCPEQPGEPCVKRIVALPEETIDIRHGDVIVDGEIQRKPIEIQRALATLVHDTAFPPTKSGVPARWRAAEEKSQWRTEGEGFVHAGAIGSGPSAAAIDWLEYRHWRRRAGQWDTVEESPILDEDSYNAAVSRQLNPVADLMLACRLSTNGPGTLHLRASDGRQQFQITIYPMAGRVLLSDSKRGPIRSVDELGTLLAADTLIEVSLFDRQILVALDGRVVLEYSCEENDAPLQFSSRPLAIGTRDLRIDISRIQVFRDVYYTATSTAGEIGALASKQPRLPCRLRPREFFVLGDNSPVSDDSRTWTAGPAMRSHWLIGKPLGVR